MPDLVVHPTAEKLEAYGQGKLSEVWTTAIALHLDTCLDCLKVVEKVKLDSFVDKLRAARPGGLSLPPGPLPPHLAGMDSVLPGAPASRADLPPELADHPKYRVERAVGRGGMGIVYLAVHTSMDRPVAIKVIHAGVLAHPEALPRFQAEVRAAAKLDHPNIVRAYDAEQAGPLHLLVMEYVEGTTLAALLRKDGPLPVGMACDLARQAALGLQHAFEQGMVHRDIKPHNLMLTPKGQVKILDFGLARLRGTGAGGPGLTETGWFMGTPEYVSPEQARDARNADVRSDLYSLGCTLYCLLAGHPPFPAEDTPMLQVLAHLSQEPRPLNQVRPEVPPELSAVVARLLAKEGGQRYQTPAELACALVPFITSGANATRAASEPLPGMASPEKGTAVNAETSEIRRPRNDESRKAATTVRAKEAPPGGTPPSDPPGPSPVRADASVCDGQLSPTPRRARLSARRVQLTGVAALLLSILTLPGTHPRLKAGSLQRISLQPTRQLEQATPPRDTAPSHVSPTPPKESPESQLQAVVAKLQELNPDFDGVVKPKIENGTVTSLALRTDCVTDLSPLRFLRGLESLECEGSAEGKGLLADLSPLSDLPLKDLRCRNNPLTDLSPLTGMPLTTLACCGTGVANLSPLEGMQLKTFCCARTPVADLSPLRGMPLQTLTCWGTRVADLSPLKGMPLVELLCGRKTSIADLSPLQGMGLKVLWCEDTLIADLTPLKEMPLTELHCQGTAVTDLSPLKQGYLTKLWCDFRPDRDTETLRAMPTLEEINGKPAADVLGRLPWAEHLNATSWAIVRLPNMGDRLYQQALELAQRACNLAVADSPHYTNTLGAAQYRLGQYAEALSSLTKACAGRAKLSKQLLPEDLAFLAMTHYQLGHKDQARTHLVRLQELVRGSGSSGHQEAQFLLREAESLIEVPPPIATFAEVRPAANSPSPPPPESHQVIPTRRAAFEPLFNGNDLTGWRLSPPASWRVIGNSVRSVRPGRASTDRDDWSDFCLVAEVYLEAGTIGALQFRSDKGHGTDNCYAVVLHTRENEPLKVAGAYRLPYVVTPGSLLLCAGSSRQSSVICEAGDKPLEPNRWHQISIEAVDHRFRITIDGNVVGNGIDLRRTYRRGRIALQRSDLVQENIYFRDMVIKQVQATD